MSSLIEDDTKERSRIVKFEDDRFDILGELVHDEAYVSHTHYGKNQTTITLCTDSFLQSVDVIESSHPSVDRSLDYFLGDKTDNSENCTSIIIHPYVEREELSEKTNRDYLDEMDKCIEYIKDIVESI